jgi:hypothetical protein
LLSKLLKNHQCPDLLNKLKPKRINNSGSGSNIGKIMY